MFSRRSLARKVMFWRRPRHIFIACFPKSGSTYLERVLRDITGYRLAQAVLAWGHNEQEIFEFRIAEQRRNCIMRQHAKAGQNNLAILQRHAIKPVILVRDIFDVVPSLLDHVEKDPRFPLCYIHPEYAAMSRDDKLALLIQAALPWYFNFLMSWREARKVIPTYWLTYRGLFADPAGQLAAILRFYDLPTDPARVAQAIQAVDTKKTNRNVGVPGRGGSMLNEAHVAAIRKLASVWGVEGCEEFRMVGL